MSNLDAPLGVRAVENGVAGVVPRLRTYEVEDSTAVYEGDLVAINSTGEVTSYSTTDAAAGDLLGVAAHPVTASQDDRELQVYDDPAQIYEVQADDNSLTVTADYLFKFFKPVATTGNTTTLQSKHELDASTGTATQGTAATNIAPVQVIGLSKAINNDEGVSFTRYLVKIVGPAHIRSDVAGINATHTGGIG
jgi:hypothetical protein